MSFAFPPRPAHDPRRLSLVLATLSLLAGTSCATSSQTVDEPGPDARRGAEPADGAREPVDVSASAAPLEVNDGVPPDAEVVAFLAPQAEQVRTRAQRVVGRLQAPMQRGKPESTLGNFVTDAMREGMGRVTGKDPDVCFTNSGGLRRDIDAGEVTEGVLVELMPFDNSIVVFEASAAQLESIVDRLAQRGDPSSGLSFTRADGKARDVRVGGEPIAKGRTYRVCTNDYVFEGGGGYPFEGVSNISYTGALLRDVLIQEFELEHKKGKAIVPALDGRVKEAK